MDWNGFKGAHFPDDIFFRAAEARHAGPDGPDTWDFVEMTCRARCMSDRAFAAEFVQAPTFAVALITEGPGEAPGVKVGATGAVFMDDSVVGELWSSEFVEHRQFAHRDVLENHGQKVVRIGRAAREIHDRLAGNDRIDANRAVGFGSAEGTPPHDAQEPIATTAAACDAISFAT